VPVIITPVIDTIGWTFSNYSLTYVGSGPNSIDLTRLVSPGLNWKMGCQWTGPIASTLTLYTYNPIGETFRVISIPAIYPVSYATSECWVYFDVSSVLLCISNNGCFQTKLTFAGHVNGMFIANDGEIWLDYTDNYQSLIAPILNFTCDHYTVFTGAHRFNYFTTPLSVYMTGSRKCGVSKELLFVEEFNNPTTTSIIYKMEVDTSLTTTQILSSTTSISLSTQWSVSSSYDVSASEFGISASYGFSTSNSFSNDTTTSQSSTTSEEFSTTSVKKIQFNIQPNSSITIQKFKVTQACKMSLQPPFNANMMELSTGLRYNVPLGGNIERLSTTIGSEYSLK